MGLQFREVKNFFVRDFVITGSTSFPQTQSTLFTVPIGRTWLCVAFGYRFTFKPDAGSFSLELYRSDGPRMANVTDGAPVYTSFPINGLINPLFDNLVLKSGESIRISDSTAQLAQISAMLQVVEFYGG